MLRRVALMGPISVMLGIAGVPEAAHSATGMATVIVHVSSVGGPKHHSGGHLPDARWHITKLGPHGEALSGRTTTDTTIHVVPGLYKIGAPDHGRYRGERRMTLRAGQTREVFLTAVKF